MGREANPTPGPWRVEERSSYFGVFSTERGYGFKDRLVAACAKPHDDATPNALLIAAAPELLAALRELADVSRAYLHAMDADDLAALEAARAALAKAEGRKP